MNYDELDVDAIVAEVHKALDEGRMRPATELEKLRVQAAAEKYMLNKMQTRIKELETAEREQATIPAIA